MTTLGWASFPLIRASSTKRAESSGPPLRRVFTATLRDGSGATAGTGFFRVTPGAASCAIRNGTGINSLGFDCATLPVLGTTFTTTIPTTGNVLTAAQVALAPQPMPLPIPGFAGEALIAFSSVRVPGFGSHDLVLPANNAFTGLTFFMQGFALDSNTQVVFYNAIDAIVGS